MKWTSEELHEWAEEKRARQNAALATCRHRARLIAWGIRWDGLQRKVWQCDACGTYFPTEESLDAMCRSTLTQSSVP